MARTFDGSVDGLETGEFRLTSYPFTVSCWYRTTNSSVRMAIAGFSSETTANAELFDNYLAGDGSRKRYVIRLLDASAQDNNQSTTDYIYDDTWNHYLCHVTSSKINVYINGSYITSNWNHSINLPASSTTTVGVRNNGGTYQFRLDGALAEAAWWDVELDDEEIASLGSGASPALIRPGSRVHYWPLRNGLQDLGPHGDTLAEISGSSTAHSDDHPRIWYPSQRIIVPFSPAVVITGTSATSLPMLETSSSGTHTIPPVTGTSSTSLPMLETSSSGTHTIPAVTGTSSTSLPALQTDSSGTHTIPPVTGTSSTSLPMMQTASSGTHTLPAVTGTSATSIPMLTTASSGTHTPPAVTGTSATSIPMLTTASEGTALVAVTGTSAVTLPMIETSSTGLMHPSGTSAVSLPMLQTASSGSTPISARPFAELTASYDVEANLTASHDVEAELTASHDVEADLTASHDLEADLTGSHDLDSDLTGSWD